VYCPALIHNVSHVTTHVTTHSETHSHSDPQFKSYRINHWNTLQHMLQYPHAPATPAPFPLSFSHSLSPLSAFFPNHFALKNSTSNSAPISIFPDTTCRLQHIASHCNTLQHITYSKSLSAPAVSLLTDHSTGMRGETPVRCLSYSWVFFLFRN